MRLPHEAIVETCEIAAKTDLPSEPGTGVAGD